MDVGNCKGEMQKAILLASRGYHAPRMRRTSVWCGVDPAPTDMK